MIGTLSVFVWLAPRRTCHTDDIRLTTGFSFEIRTWAYSTIISLNTYFRVEVNLENFMDILGGPGFINQNQSSNKLVFELEPINWDNNVAVLHSIFSACVA